MSMELARQVAETMLYEGYVLYPYRASAQKNRSRWQFGVLMPASYALKDTSETSWLQAECILAHDAGASVEVVLRFLQVQRRSVTTGSMPDWDEAVEQEIDDTIAVSDLLAGGYAHEFVVDGGVTVEPLPDEYGEIVRSRLHLSGTLQVTAEPLVAPTVRAVRLRVRLDNTTVSDALWRDDALPSAMIAAHVLLAVDSGAFASMVDPPAWAVEAVSGCSNAGTWPVLAGDTGGDDVMLCAPIILYDHPALAPESPGDLYDATEIDEILTLRTLALTDEEKREARATDPRAAAVIDRSESLDADAFGRLHGIVREMRPVPAALGDDEVPWWDPGADASVSPETDAVMVAGRRIVRGSNVVLRPGSRRADAQDMFLVGREAQVQAVLFDVDDNPYLAVSLTDDDAEMQHAHGRFLYFAPDEVEPVEVER